MYNKIFAHFYDPFMKSFEENELIQRRKKLLGNLNGSILEIGSGTGINFPLFNPETCSVFALEPSIEMWKMAEKKYKQTKFPEFIKPLKFGIDDPELFQTIQPESMDAVVCTLVLCTVPDLKKSIEVVHKSLKKGGKLILIEHICSSKPITKTIQNTFNPFWKYFAEGCNLNRNTDQLLLESGFKVIREERFENWFPFIEAEMIK